jgi:hypothetical protein
MSSLPLTLALALNLVTAEPAPSAVPAIAPGLSTAVTPPEESLCCPGGVLNCCDTDCCCPRARRLFESDHAFDNFIGPISNPILSKDPRSLTEARVLFINNEIDPQSLLGSGDFQVAACEVRVALTDRLTFIADKDGYAWIHPSVPALKGEGWLNINAGLKYTLVRDVEDQFLLTGGLTYEPPTGEAAVFQGLGDGVFTVFLASGKEFGNCAHLLGTVGYQFPVNSDQNSSFYYLSLHVDQQLLGWLYPLLEFNWFHYASGGDHGLPPVVGEGDGLLNLGTSGVAGTDLVTLAVGLKAHLSCHADTGVAWEFPISNRHDLLNNRLIAEMILRY